MFKEELIEEQNQLKVVVSIEKRKLITDKKLIYYGDPWDLIPEDIKDQVQLISGPTLSISNMNRAKYSNVGVWVFEKKKKTTRRTRAKKTVDKK